MTIITVSDRERQLERDVAELRLEKRDIDFAYMEGFEAAKHEARDAYHAEIDALKAKLAEYEKRIREFTWDGARESWVEINRI